MGEEMHASKPLEHKRHETGPPYNTPSLSSKMSFTSKNVQNLECSINSATLWSWFSQKKNNTNSLTVILCKEWDFM